MLYFHAGFTDTSPRAIAVDPLMPRTRAKLAVPFVGKDSPSRSSEFVGTSC